jgi:hypothetical protein
MDATGGDGWRGKRGVSSRVRWVGVLVAVAFFAAVMISMGSSAKPQMSGMAMRTTTKVPSMPSGMVIPGWHSAGADGGRPALVLRDAAAPVHRVPGSGPGVLLFFKARGCATCRRSASTLASIERAAGTDVDLHAVSLSATDEPDATTRFRVAAHAPDLPVVTGAAARTVSQRFGDPPAGTVLLYDRRGEVTGQLAAPTATSLRAAVHRLLSRRREM